MVKEGGEDGEEWKEKMRLRRRDLKTLMGMCEEEKGQVMEKMWRGQQREVEVVGGIVKQTEEVITATERGG